VNASLEITPSPTPGGLPSVKLGFGLQRPEHSTTLLPDVLDAVNAQIERRRRSLGLGLDEFQRIHDWGGEDAEWALREAMQRHRAIAYVLVGSKRHLIEAMVASKGRALWKMVDPMEFGPMDDHVLAEWIADRATVSGVQIPLETADRIMRLARPRTRDVVQLARAVWDEAAARGAATPADADRAMEQLVREQAALYETIWATLNARQQMVLRAVAAEPHVQLTAAATLRRYGLGAKSSAQSVVERLLDAEHLTRLASGWYAFDDPFFRRWVQVYGLPDLGLPVPPLRDA
jgi:hypothetical protein